MRKKQKLLLILVGFINFTFTCGLSAENVPHMVDKVNSARAIERRGEKLYKEGLYDDALELFKKADGPEYRLYKDGLNDYARSYMRMIYLIKGNYEKGLELSNELLAKYPDAKANLEAKAMFEALIAAKSRKDNGPVYQFIHVYRVKNMGNLPPKAYKFTSPAPISTILRLYDTIGDHDAGIAFVDEVLAYFRTGKAGDPKPGWVDAEYMKVREAFQQDKAQGTKGRATKALIQSDYFPW